MCWLTNRVVKMRVLIEIPDEEQFRVWLSEERKISERRVIDVCSRLRRCSKLLQQPVSKMDHTTFDLLKNNSTFKNFGYSIKSQLRGALRLYLTFIGQ